MENYVKLSLTLRKEILSKRYPATPLHRVARAKKGRASDRLDLVAAHKGVRAMRNDLITLLPGQH